jgi:hypothetical protein
MTPRIAMISGHLDLTQEEFEAYYLPYILEALLEGNDFVVGDAPGADEMAQKYLAKRIPQISPASRVTVYHMYTIPRHNAGFATKNGFTKDTSKDAAMTADSDFDIAWVRPEKHSSVSGRVSGTEQNLLRRKAKTMGKD